MAERIVIQGQAGTLPAYLALPESGRGAPLIVLQEYWGLVPHIEEVTDRFAAEGFVALAPDLYHGETGTHPDDASRLLMELNIEDAARDVVAAAGYLATLDAATSTKPSLMGFCMGGALAMIAAAQLGTAASAVVSFYGVFWRGVPDLTGIACPVLMHVGSADEHIPVQMVTDLATVLHESGGDAQLHVYDGAGHAFYNDSRPEVFDADAARLAEERSLAFLRAHTADAPTG